MNTINISILQDQRLKDKIQKKENSLRRKIEKKLQCVAEKEVELSNEFPDISECKKNVILSVLSNVSVINGLHFEQLWYVDHHNVQYNGHIICVKQSKKSQVPIVGRMMNEIITISLYHREKIVFRTLGFNLSTMGSVPSNVFKDFEYV